MIWMSLRNAFPWRQRDSMNVLPLVVIHEQLYDVVEVGATANAIFETRARTYVIVRTRVHVPRAGRTRKAPLLGIIIPISLDE